ncbi:MULTISPECIES: LptF/LptG family permease [unclassified Acidisoma]|uniref:LptF/LptG family permease n=1 Tax=unclassified Acidisoma TaxID=2634065 RepID=UPI00131CB697|nr:MULTISPECIES: LptF/LptG family permease [unclassified Acidisoma]
MDGFRSVGIDDLRATPAKPRRGSARTIPRYLLVLTAGPFTATLLIVLPALLIERLLRLFDLIASTDAPAGSVGRMLVDLVPHYLGLALPAAIFIGIHFVIARLSAGSELEAMQNAGLSLAWISRPFLLLGAIAAAGGFGLYGYLEPLSRYAYRAAYQTATEGTWNGVIPPGQIIQVSKNLIVTADASDPATGALSHVFVYQRAPDGKEKLTTGRSGTLVLSDDGTQVMLSLKNGEQMNVLPDNRIDSVSSDSTTMHHPFLLHFANFRARGFDEREMTMGELWHARNHPHPPQPVRRLDGEFHSRLVRSLSLVVLPLLAISIGLAAKRTRRQYGIVVGVIILVLYDHAVQLAQAIGTAGLMDPRLPLWGCFLTFTVFCLWMFRRAVRHTSEGPFDRIFDLLERASDRIARAWRRPVPMGRRKIRAW